MRPPIRYSRSVPGRSQWRPRGSRSPKRGWDWFNDLNTLVSRGDGGPSVGDTVRMLRAVPRMEALNDARDAAFRALNEGQSIRLYLTFASDDSINTLTASNEAQLFDGKLTTVITVQKPLGGPPRCQVVPAPDERQVQSQVRRALEIWEPPELPRLERSDFVRGEVDSGEDRWMDRFDMGLGDYEFNLEL